MADRTLRDSGLTRRMAVVMVYLALVFAAAVVIVVASLHQVGLLLVALALLALLVGWFSSGPVSLRAIGARLVTPDDEPALHGSLDRMCALSGVPKPRLAIAKAADPNAFALGRSQKYAVIVLTRPLVDLLEPEELDAVLAHELAHLAHRDLLVMTAGSPGILMSLTGNVLRDGAGRLTPFVLAAWAFTGVVHLLCYLPVRLLSRYRELCADAASAHLTQRPGALASGLQKISGAITPIPSADLRSRAVVETFGIVSVDARGRGGLTDTHPSIERRMAQLARIGAELGRPSV